MAGYGTGAAREWQWPGLTLLRASVSFHVLSPNAYTEVHLVIDPALARVLFWTAVVGCAIAQLLIVRAAARGYDDAVAEGIPHPSRGAEMAWTILPGVMLALVLFLTWRALPRERRARELPVTAAAYAPDIPSAPGAGSR